MAAKKDNFVAQVLYKSEIEEEKLWEKDKCNEHDIAVRTNLLNEIRCLGYNYHYIADITHRENSDMRLLELILKYIGKFYDEGISAELVGIVGKKGNYSATETILNNYRNSSEKNKHIQAVFYDNALNEIKDKRFISIYLELLKNPEDAIKLPLTMILLGKWQVREAVPFFLQYLHSTLHYLNKSTSDLVFIALIALGYYRDTNGSIQNAIEPLLESKDKSVISAAKKAVKRIKRNSGDR